MKRIGDAVRLAMAQELVKDGVCLVNAEGEVMAELKPESEPSCPLSTGVLIEGRIILTGYAVAITTKDGEKIASLNTPMPLMSTEHVFTPISFDIEIEQNAAPIHLNTEVVP